MAKKPATLRKKKAPMLRKTKVAKAKKKVSAKNKKKVSAKSKKKVLAIPKGYHSITPYLIVNNAAMAIEFYKKVFGAKEVLRMDQPGGRVGHAELKIGDAKIMLADECPEMNAHSPQTGDSSPVSIHLYTKNVDATVDLAMTAGAKIIKPVQDMFYGDRSGTLEDPFGHKWHVSTHIEDVSIAKMKKRAAELFGSKEKPKVSSE